jgi:hypothetical protein
MYCVVQNLLCPSPYLKWNLEMGSYRSMISSIGTHNVKDINWVFEDNILSEIPGSNTAKVRQGNRILHNDLILNFTDLLSLNEIVPESSRNIKFSLKWRIPRGIFQCQQLVTFMKSLQSNFYHLRPCCCQLSAVCFYGLLVLRVWKYRLQRNLYN